ncbi:MAG: insulinase family protein [Phycisphaerales bacterium]|nr:insulinase family protein [Phycisphaerales bacterium]
MTSIQLQTLDCGMPLVVEEMPGVRSAAMTWLVPAGTATEPADRQGVSSMWAELLMRGAGALASRDHADALDRLGVSKSTDAASYHLRLSATMIGARVGDALPLLTDMILRPRMDQEAIEPTRDLALQAIDALKDDPQQRASNAARSRHYPVPLNRTATGTRHGVEAVTRDELVNGWRERARPRGCFLAFAGAVRADALRRQLNDLLKGWDGAAPAFSLAAAPPRGYAHEQDQTNQVQIFLLHDAPAEPEPGSVLEKVAASVLSGGMAGRLFTEVREKRGLCYSVSAGYASGRDFGSVTAYVGTTPERAQESLDVLWAELARIGTPDGAVSREEFERAVVGMKSRLVFAGESTAARAAGLASDLHRLGRARGLAEMAAQIDGVTLEQVAAYLRHRSLGRVTIQTLGPAPLTPPATCV